MKQPRGRRKEALTAGIPNKVCWSMSIPCNGGIKAPPTMAIAAQAVLPNLLSDRRNEAGEIIFYALSEAEKASIRIHDLAVIRNPYVALGVVVLLILIVIACKKMPQVAGEGKQSSTRETLSRLWKNRLYREGVATQMFYVAAQIMVWTFIIQYADSLGIDKATAQKYNIAAMAKRVRSRRVLT